MKKRYAIVGTGGRAAMYVDATSDTFREHADLVGLCDISQTRMEWHNARRVKQFQLPPVPTFAAAEFDRMVTETRPDVVIVTSMDCTHHQYIIRAMELGCDVITEKPMTIDAEKGNAIFAAAERTGRKLRVTFNYRYAPAVTKLREVIMQGAIGRPLAVTFAWMLDTGHGADYFRRWHREKDKSGGLLVHKATHHFDLINWWLASWPETVFAMGDLKFYGKQNAEARGEHYDYNRYTGHPEAANDPFALFLDKSADPADGLRGLYLNAEKDSGYIRDRNVFGEPVSIEDTMALVARYRNGVILNYSLVAYSPWEGFQVAISGTKGRLEYHEKHGSHIIAGQNDEEIAIQQARGLEQRMRVFPMFGLPYDVAVPKAEGGHGGGDSVMLEQIFSPNPPADPFKRAASHLDGAASILIGISANRSIATGLPVRCADLIKLPVRPE